MVSSLSSVIVNQVHVHNFAVLEAEHHAPVAGDAHAPLSGSITFQFKGCSDPTFLEKHASAGPLTIVHAPPQGLRWKPRFLSEVAAHVTQKPFDQPRRKVIQRR